MNMTKTTPHMGTKLPSLQYYGLSLLQNYYVHYEDNGCLEWSYIRDVNGEYTSPVSGPIR